MSNPDTEMSLFQENASSPDVGMAKSTEQVTEGKIDLNLSISSRLRSVGNDCLRQLQSTMELLHATISEIRLSSDDINEQLHHSREQTLLRKHQLEEERLRVHHAACRAISVLNDTIEGS